MRRGGLARRGERGRRVEGSRRGAPSTSAEKGLIMSGSWPLPPRRALPPNASASSSSSSSSSSSVSHWPVRSSKVRA
eukprot:1119980-Prymnesium_polylepis.2